MISADSIPDPYSSLQRPILTGVRGAASTAHPLATAAAQEQLANGGSAADAVVAAQAVLSVIAPESGGLGGDAFFLVWGHGGQPLAINAAGKTSRTAVPAEVRDDGSSVTVPGIVAGWQTLHDGWGRRSLGDVLMPACILAEAGFPVRPQLTRAVLAQHGRLIRGACGWSILDAADGKGDIHQFDLARTLENLGQHGASWFYEGRMAHAMSDAIRRNGGNMDVRDFAAHRTVVTCPLTISWRGLTIHLQPPMSQGVLLGMALQGLESIGRVVEDRLDHIAIELTEAAFSYRDRAGEGTGLLHEPMSVDTDRAARRGGPRSYLHTAGAAASDADGLVIASLLSVFDDFGSCIFVPEGGFVLNNRAAGFTFPPNHIAPEKMPVHTLAPMLVESGSGRAGMATPGADGQIQTLMQVLIAATGDSSLDIAINRPRWRSENGRVLLEASHPGADLLIKRGHDVVTVVDGDGRFGSIVCAGTIGETPFAVSDWRRESWSGVV